MKINSGFGFIIAILTISGIIYYSRFHQGNLIPGKDLLKRARGTLSDRALRLAGNLAFTTIIWCWLCPDVFKNPTLIIAYYAVFIALASLFPNSHSTLPRNLIVVSLLVALPWIYYKSHHPEWDGKVRVPELPTISLTPTPQPVAANQITVIAPPATDKFGREQWSELVKIPERCKHFKADPSANVWVKPLVGPPYMDGPTILVKSGPGQTRNTLWRQYRSTTNRPVTIIIEWN